MIAGENDSRATYERLHTPDARLVVANCEDTVNTNITLTVREVAPQVHIAAIVEEEDSVDILNLSGATTVLPLKRQLGESLANRVETGRTEAHVIGSFHNVHVAELPVKRHAPGGNARARYAPARADRPERGRAVGARPAASPHFRTPRFAPMPWRSSPAPPRRFARSMP